MVTETLRFDGPAQALLRVAVTETELSGTTIPAGAHVLPLVGSANRDPRRFPDADEFRPDRPNMQDHLAFGAGIHYCIGSALARMEATTAIEEIARRMPALAPAGTPQRIASPVLRGLRSQPVTLGAATTPMPWLRTVPGNARPDRPAAALWARSGRAYRPTRYDRGDETYCSPASPEQLADAYGPLEVCSVITRPPTRMRQVMSPPSGPLAAVMDTIRPQAPMSTSLRQGSETAVSRVIPWSQPM